MLEGSSTHETGDQNKLAKRKYDTVQTIANEIEEYPKCRQRKRYICKCENCSERKLCRETLSGIACALNEYGVISYGPFISRKAVDTIGYGRWFKLNKAGTTLIHDSSYPCMKIDDNLFVICGKLENGIIADTMIEYFTQLPCVRRDFKNDKKQIYGAMYSWLTEKQREIWSRWSEEK